MSDLLAVIMAAGQGTRMKSRTPKVLHRLAGKPVLDYVVEAAREAGAGEIILIIGHEGERVREHFSGASVSFVEQTPQLGTGHAVQQALPLLRGHHGAVLVLYGDMPLLGAGAMRSSVERRQEAQAQVAFLAGRVENPDRYGRVVRQPDGRVRIVEWADASEEERRICEVNAGVYCFDTPWLVQELPSLTVSKKGEYYLTDLVERAERAEVVPISAMTDCLGVDTRAKLAEAERIIQDRLRKHWMDEGVGMVDPSSVYLDARSSIGQDTVIYPNTWVENSQVGESCRLGPGTILRDTKVGDACTIEYSVLDSSVVEDEVEIGPFSHLRPGSHIRSRARLGNYVEIKNASIGEETDIHHFSYTGDAEVGRGVNIGAGTITVNLNTETGIKNRTVIEDGASIGSDTMLVAPVAIGAGAMTATGSVVTHDVPAGKLAKGVPARITRDVRKGQE